MFFITSYIARSLLLIVVVILLNTVTCNPIREVESTVMSSKFSRNMRILAIRSAEIAHPTGDPNFAVNQAFPRPFTAEESDPFLMCDVFGPTVSKGIETNPDKFPVGWHPHRGMDLLTYLTEGVGRHADSMGNRETFQSPGMQWTSAGSGIEHAEGGGTPAGQTMQGFQIWVNVPSSRKMDDPKYGTEPPENIPVITFAPDSSRAGFVRVLAGQLADKRGPFRTIQPVQILDYNFPTAGEEVVHTVPVELNNCLLYVYKGSVRINDQDVTSHQCVRMDASTGTGESRSFTITATTADASVIVFSGERLNEPIAWHGPFVMNTDAEIRATLREYSTGTFLKKRASWDYKRIATKPTN